MRLSWAPYFFGTRITAKVRCADPLGMAREVIAMRGPVLESATNEALRFAIPTSTFLLPNPFALISRISVRIAQAPDGDRLVYDLSHPWDVPVVIIAFMVFVAERSLLNGIVLLCFLFALLHSFINYFVHRDIVRSIAEGVDRGERLIIRAKDHVRDSGSGPE
jgi:hypothetical protein